MLTSSLLAVAGVGTTGPYAEGGTVSQVTVEGVTYRVHTFTTVGSSTLNVLSGGVFEYLVVGGGGSGGGWFYGGGGGAGGFLTGGTILNGGTQVSVSVGGGGLGTLGGQGQNGGNSSLGSIVAIGGGGGGRDNSGDGPGLSGGSGGGGSASGRLGGAGTTGQGYKGGDGGPLSTGSNARGGGGGGAGGAGANGVDGGAGGPGLTSAISGSSVTYANGGAGALRGLPIRDGAPGSSNTGSGGGGGGADLGAPAPGQASGGSGGSGIVIVRYPLPTARPVSGVIASGGTESYYVDSGNLYKVHVFNSSGTLTVSSGGSGVEYLIIGGGGSGSNLYWGGGGGGAGGYRSSVVGELSGNSSVAESRLTLAAQAYPVVVGSGGTAPTTTNTPGNPGSNSSFAGITSLGGGGGGTGVAGGSGGGAGYGQGYSQPQGAGTARQGGNGSPYYDNYSSPNIYGGGCGGGAKGSATGGGTGPTYTIPYAGDGLSSAITGSPVTRAGGGGALGGTNSGVGSTEAGGGGKGHHVSSATSGQAGVVIIRYRCYPLAAEDYIRRVIAADVAAGVSFGLELGVKNAYAEFIDGLISDGLLGTFNGVVNQDYCRIRSACIMAGARTLEGALVPLVGPAPTNTNFVSADYNRATGLRGNGVDKYLSSNYFSDSDPQDNVHFSVYQTSLGQGGGLIGAWNGHQTMQWFGGGITVRSRSTTATTSYPASYPAGTESGFLGVSRLSSSAYTVRMLGSDYSYSIVSGSQPGNPYFIFCDNRFQNPPPSPYYYGTNRLSIYTIGRGINLATLENRIAKLMSSLAASITTSVDSNWDNVALLLQPYPGSPIVDVSPDPKTITAWDDTKNSTEPGYPALKFDGNADKIQVSNDSSFDTNQPFTLEFFFYRLTSDDALFFIRTGIVTSGASDWNTTNGHSIAVFIQAGILYVQLNVGGSPQSHTIAAPSAGSLNYVSVSYDGSTLQSHLNSSRFGSSPATSILPTIRDQIYIGGMRPVQTSKDFNGYIRAMRWTKGVARNSGATITVPTLPFSTIPYSIAAQDYINRVTAADVAAGDSSGLETEVKNAYAQFIDGLISDGLLSTSGGVISQANSVIKAACIMAGARTLSGCLVPLVGPAPTNNNFVSGDYSRNTGILGKYGAYINSNRLITADLLDDFSYGVNITQLPPATGVQIYIGHGNNDNGSSRLARSGGSHTSRNRNSTIAALSASPTVGLFGTSRSSSSGYTARESSTTTSVTVTSQSLTNLTETFFVFGRNNNGLLDPNQAIGRLNFYFIGGSLNLVALSNRLQNLTSSLAAIP